MYSTFNEIDVMIIFGGVVVRINSEILVLLKCIHFTKSGQDSERRGTRSKLVK